MKIEFESVLFGAAFLILVLISIPEQEKDSNAPVETAAIENADAPAAPSPLSR